MVGAELSTASHNNAGIRNGKLYEYARGAHSKDIARATIKKGIVAKCWFFHTAMKAASISMIVIGMFAVPDQFSSLPISAERVVNPQVLSVRRPLSFNMRSISTGQFGIRINAARLNRMTLNDAERKKGLPPRRMTNGMNIINKCGLNNKIGNKRPA